MPVTQHADVASLDATHAAARADAVPAEAIVALAVACGLHDADPVSGRGRGADVRTGPAPGTDLGLPMAQVAAVLWSQVLRYDAADPRWPDRDRFVLCAARHSFLLYALLYLTGHEGIALRDLRRFGRLDSPAGRQTSRGLHPAIEASVGPPGQGLAMGAGMALAERVLAGRFGRSLVDHRTWVMACSTDLAAGVAQEAAALAGRMELDRLTVLFEQTDAEEGRLHAARFSACGWSVRRVPCDDAQAIATVLAAAQRTRKPMLIACTPPVGAATAATLTPTGISPDSSPGTQPVWHAAGQRGSGVRRAWLKRLKSHARRDEFLRMQRGVLPQGWRDVWLDQAATRAVGTAMPSLFNTLVPELIGLSARREEDRAEAGHDGGETMRPAPAGRGADLACGTQEHGMAGLLNGLVLHGGLRGVGLASFVSVDRMRVALRLAALMRLGVVYLLADDGLSRGEDGPAFQPVEQLASLRAMPNVMIFRPGDRAELAECWALALDCTTGPSVIALGRRELSLLRASAGSDGIAAMRRRGGGDAAAAALLCARGGYVLREARAMRQATLIATGAELSVALAARALLRGAGLDVAVVSLPCWELFERQDPDYRARVLGDVPRIGIEAASGFGWERWLGTDGVFIGMDGFGASAPAPDLYRHFGITPDAVADAVRRAIGVGTRVITTSVSSLGERTGHAG